MSFSISIDLAYPNPTGPLRVLFPIAAGDDWRARCVVAESRGFASEGWYVCAPHAGMRDHLYLSIDGDWRDALDGRTKPLHFPSELAARFALAYAPPYPDCPKDTPCSSESGDISGSKKTALPTSSIADTSLVVSLEVGSRSSSLLPVSNSPPAPASEPVLPWGCRCEPFENGYRIENADGSYRWRSWKSEWTKCEDDDKGGHWSTPELAIKNGPTVPPPDWKEPAPSPRATDAFSVPALTVGVLGASQPSVQYVGLDPTREIITYGNHGDPIICSFTLEGDRLVEWKIEHQDESTRNQQELNAGIWSTGCPEARSGDPLFLRGSAKEEDNDFYVSTVVPTRADVLRWGTSIDQYNAARRKPAPTTPAKVESVDASFVAANAGEYHAFNVIYTSDGKGRVTCQGGEWCGINTHAENATRFLPLSRTIPDTECGHDDCKYIPDPSGNNDTEYKCNGCGKYLSWSERIKYKQRQAAFSPSLSARREDAAGEVERIARMLHESVREFYLPSKWEPYEAQSGRNKDKYLAAARAVIADRAKLSPSLPPAASEKERQFSLSSMFPTPLPGEPTNPILTDGTTALNARWKGWEGAADAWRAYHASEIRRIVIEHVKLTDSLRTHLAKLTAEKDAEIERLKARVVNLEDADSLIESVRASNAALRDRLAAAEEVCKGVKAMREIEGILIVTEDKTVAAHDAWVASSPHAETKAGGK